MCVLIVHFLIRAMMSSKHFPHTPSHPPTITHSLLLWKEKAPIFAISSLRNQIVVIYYFIINNIVVS